MPQVPDPEPAGDERRYIHRVTRHGLRALFAVPALVALASSLILTAHPAAAAAPNTIAVYIQPMKACQWGRMNVMWCLGSPGAPIAISADPATNAPLWAGTGYALCWTTAAGTVLPAGASCSASGSAIASGNDGSYDVVADFPMTIDGSGGSGCEPHVNNAKNSFFFSSGTVGTCTITIPTPATPGFTATTTVFTLQVGIAPEPTINGTVTAISGRGRVGTTAPLLTNDCEYENQFSVFSQCPGVELNWSVLTGKASCRIAKITRNDSRALGSVRVRFIAPGRCTIQGSYPAVAGQSAAYSTPVFRYTVQPRRR